MNKFKLLILSNIFLILIIVILNVIILNQKNLITEYKGENTELSKLEEEILILEEKNDELNKEILKLEEEKNTKEKEIQKLNDELENMKTIDAASIEKLKEKGISDYKIISEDLKKHPELIPFDGVLGGKMFFTRVYLLNDHWVYARFEDGHIQGYGLYEYTIDESSEISWQVIKGILDE